MKIPSNVILSLRRKEASETAGATRRTSFENLNGIQRTPLLDRKVDTVATLAGEMKLGQAIDEIIKEAEAQNDPNFDKIKAGLEELRDKQTIQKDLPALLDKYGWMVVEHLAEDLNELKEKDSSGLEAEKTLVRIDEELTFLGCLEMVIDHLVLKGCELLYKIAFYASHQIVAIEYLLKREENQDPQKISDYVNSLNLLRQELDSSSSRNQVAELIMDNLMRLQGNVQKEACETLRYFAQAKLIDVEARNKIAEFIGKNLKSLKGAAQEEAILTLRYLAENKLIEKEARNKIAKFIGENLKSFQGDIQKEAYWILLHLANNNLIDDKVIGNALVEEILSNLKDLPSVESSRSYIILDRFISNNLINDKEVGNKIANAVLNDIITKKDTRNKNAYSLFSALTNKQLFDDRYDGHRLAEMIVNNLNTLKDTAKTDAVVALANLAHQNLIIDKSIRNKAAEAVSSNLKSLPRYQQKPTYLALLSLERRSLIKRTTEVKIAEDLIKLLPDPDAWAILINLATKEVISWKILDKFLTKEMVDIKIGNLIAERIMNNLTSSKNIDDVYWRLGTLINNKLIDSTTGNKLAKKILEVYPNLSLEAQSAAVPILPDLIRMNLVDDDMKKDIKLAFPKIWE